jgi:hypothetical protein
VEERFDYDQLAAALDMHIAELLGKKVAASVPLTPASVKATTEKS